MEFLLKIVHMRILNQNQTYSNILFLSLRLVLQKIPLWLAPKGNKNIYKRRRMKKIMLIYYPVIVTLT